jgi:quinol monooxygenase YgiN
MMAKLDEFEHLAASDNIECLIFERYRDSQALLDHQQLITMEK